MNNMLNIQEEGFEGYPINIQGHGPPMFP